MAWALFLAPLLFGAEDGPACEIIFAPAGTTTEGSGYTAIVAGADGSVYVGSARYGSYGCLLELEPRTRKLKIIASLEEITGEHLTGIRTQAKIHSKMSIGSDGKVYFASKQGHEIFDTRPEYEDSAGYPGGSSSFSSCSTNCIKYTWSQGARAFTGGSGGGWPASAQQACIQPYDQIGVYVKLDHRFVTGLFGSNVTLTDHAVFRFEPQPATEC